jgi:hypothetical protein
MISVTIAITQAASQAAPQAAPAVPAVPSAEQIREQVRASIEAARAAQADANLARAQGGNRRVSVGPEGIIVTPNEPGQPTVLIGPRAAQNMIPPQAVDISIAFFIMIAVMVVGWPIARAFGRRIERRGQVATLDTGTMEQLQRIEQAVDAMAIEVERISESQRFMAKLQHETSTQALPGAQSR